MSKRARTIFACIMLALALALISAFFSLSGPHGKVIARAQHKDGHGYAYTVTVKQFGGRYNIALVAQGTVRDLLLSSYEFYTGSIPATNATVSWPELHSFAVRFDNEIAVDCAWDQSKVIWTKH